VFKRLRIAQQAALIRAEPAPLPGRGPYRVLTADPSWLPEVRREDPSHLATYLAGRRFMSRGALCRPFQPLPPQRPTATGTRHSEQEKKMTDDMTAKQEKEMTDDMTVKQEKDMTDDMTVEQWLAIRKEAALQIDPETAEVMWKHAHIMDPYGVDPDLPEEYQCVGRGYFARFPGGDIWVSFYDLPEVTTKALRARIEAGDFDRNDDSWLLG
jgi:hypothetical protein